MTDIFIVAALLVVGMLLLVAEVAIIPGFGVAGVSGIALLAGGIVFAWTKFGMMWGVGSLLLAGGATAAVLIIVPKTRAGKAFVLDKNLENAEAGAKVVLMGKSGVTITALRPAGVAEIEGKRIDVVSDGVFIEAGCRVQVVVVDGPRVVVAPTENV